MTEAERTLLLWIACRLVHTGNEYSTLKPLIDAVKAEAGISQERPR